MGAYIPPTLPHPRFPDMKREYRTTPNYKKRTTAATYWSRARKRVNQNPPSLCFIIQLMQKPHKQEKMEHQIIQGQDMTRLVLSSDAKPRLKWTPELHRRFIDAVSQLGGAEKATPKSLKRVMGIPGLTLYHLKSHLQKYRLGKSQQSDTCHGNKPQDDKGCLRRDYHFGGEILNGTQNQINKSWQIAQALKMQKEVQRELHQQIEVQRHLQLRIEAQGKYLQSVLKKAQETLFEYSSSSVGVELAKAELSQLVSIIDNGWPSSSLSVITTDIGGSSQSDRERNPMSGTGCSLESTITSSESSGREEDKQQTKHENENGDVDKLNEWPVELSLMDMNSKEKGNKLSASIIGRKRSGSTISDGNYGEQPSGKRSERIGDQRREFLENLDLNSHCLNNDF